MMGTYMYMGVSICQGYYSIPGGGGGGGALYVLYMIVQGLD